MQGTSYSVGVCYLKEAWSLSPPHEKSIVHPFASSYVYQALSLHLSNKASRKGSQG